MTRTATLPPLAREAALGFGYWLAFLLALEPGNIANMHHVLWGAEFARIVGAATIGAAATPLVLALVRRYPVEGAERWRRAALEAAAAVVIAAGLIFVSCVLADWFLATEHRPFAVALVQELFANGPLLFFCIGGLLALGHAMQFARAREAATAVTAPSYPATVIAKSRGRTTVVDIAAVDWIEAQGNYVALHAGAECHLIRDTLGAFESRLDPAVFTRIHRRTIVARNRVAAIAALGTGDSELILRDGTPLRLSRNFKDALIGSVLVYSNSKELALSVRI